MSYYIIDYFSAFQGSTSSMLETTSKFTSVDMKYALDIFSLFVEKQFDDPKTLGIDPDQIGKDLSSSALNVELVGDEILT